MPLAQYGLHQQVRASVVHHRACACGLLRHLADDRRDRFIAGERAPRRQVRWSSRFCQDHTCLQVLGELTDDGGYRTRQGYRSYQRALRLI